MAVRHLFLLSALLVLGVRAADYEADMVGDNVVPPVNSDTEAKFEMVVGSGDTAEWELKVEHVTDLTAAYLRYVSAALGLGG